MIHHPSVRPPGERGPVEALEHEPATPSAASSPRAGGARRSRWARLGGLRALRFALVGFSGVFVNLGALHAFASGLGVHRVLASAAAVEVSILSNFLLNDAWTFRDRNATAAVTARGRFFRYHLVSLVGMAVQLAVFESANQGVMVALGRADPGAFIYPAQLLGIAAATAWNFVSNLRWTWAQARDPEDA